MMLDCNEIIPNRLWVGRFVRPSEVNLLKQMEITTLVSLQSDEDLSTCSISEKKLLKACAEAGVELRRVATRDFDKTALATNLSQCVAEIEAALTPLCARVYLHCTAGVNRAPTAAAAYLIRSRRMSAQDAHEFVTSKRHCSPFLDLLEKYEQSLQSTTTGSKDPRQHQGQ